MQVTSESLLELTAGDVMVSDLVVLRETMPLREAARILFENQVSGAPVVDSHGSCVGVLSTTDFLRLAVKHAHGSKQPPLPGACLFQIKHRDKDGKDVTLCTLPLGACAIQRTEKGNGSIVCSQPNCVPVDWQMIDVEMLPLTELQRYMTADPVTVERDVSIAKLARMMVDAHIHRVVVVDENHKPIGIVASTDLLNALGRGSSEDM